MRKKTPPTKAQKAIKAANIPQMAIAKDLGVSCAAVSLVLAGTSVSKRIRAHIAKQLGLSQEELWPHENA